jgi:hypothetical protein
MWTSPPLTALYPILQFGSSNFHSTSGPIYLGNTQEIGSSLNIIILANYLISTDASNEEMGELELCSCPGTGYKSVGNINNVCMVNI